MFESDTDTEVIPKLLKYLYHSQVCILCRYLFLLRTVKEGFVHVLK